MSKDPVVCIWPLKRLQFCLACMRQAGRERSVGVPMATQEAAILRNLHGAEGWRERSGLLMTTHEAANLLGLHGAEGWEGKIQ